MPLHKSSKTPVAIHPGIILKEELKARHLSATRVALDLGVPPNLIAGILHGKRSITAETALRRARYFGNSAHFWMALQMDYDLAVAEREKMKEIERTVRAA
ncbi:MAG: addiction module antidote protein, HigA family [Rhodospirillales bacterium]|nr:addiction module antidote protein, HigA family [Rhodospirillales bacterium]